MKKRVMRAAIMACAGVLAMGLPAVAQAAPATADSGAVITYEKGHVLSCTGQAGQRSVTVELYDNSLHGSFVNAHVEGPDGEYGGGSTPTRLFDHSSINAELPIERLGEDTSPAGTAVIKGLYALKGKPTPVHDVYQDDGWTIVSEGTHQRLKPKVTVRVLGKTARLTCADAFAYDLKVTKTPM
ncbi:hypothetical protein [Streptomyces sp. NPDC058664]|uniref:hypothetical protein n=1 Tax=unclassified Streptomyces TaxID=2593676 RepID=UPI00365D56E8